MQLIKISSRQIHECYDNKLVRPNEFRDICNTLIEKELQLRMESVNLYSLIKSHLKKENFFEEFYRESSDCKDALYQCIIKLASENSSSLLIKPHEAKKLFISYIFYTKSKIVRDCSDMFNHAYREEDFLFVDKETIRAIDYLLKYSASAEELLRDYT